MKESQMFSEYVVRAVVAEHVERLRTAAAADRLARSVRSTPLPSAPATPGRLRLRLAHPLTGTARHAQPGAC
jgi:hypothetical protein